MRLSPELQLSNTNDARATAVQNALDTARLLTQVCGLLSQCVHMWRQVILQS